jgi:site-specific recombinase XerD
MLNDLVIRNLAENTQKSDLQAVIGLTRYYRRSPDQLSVQEVQAYLLYLSQERHLAWTSCNTIRHGLRFFYQVTLDRPTTQFYLPCAKEPSKLPQILSHEELVHLFTVTTNRKHRALLMTPYAAGLRASEVTRLRISDIDSARQCIRVDQGKGRKDRYVPLAPRLLTQLRAYWREARPPHWLFPGTRIDCHMSREAAWDIYVKARDKAGITKEGGLHLLRHNAASRIMPNVGCDVRFPVDGSYASGVK